MLRLFRQRAVSRAVSRAALAAASRMTSSSQVLHVHRVRLQKPSLLARATRFGIGVTAAYVAYRVYSSVVLGPLVRYVEEEEGQLSEEEKRKIEEEFEDSVWGFPIPFTMRMVDPPPYERHDPEIATFHKINNDRELKQKITRDLAEDVRAVADRSPSIHSRLGDLHVGKYWLHVTFPSTPPPICIQNTIIIDDDLTVSVEIEEIEPEVFLTARQAFRPTAVVAGLLDYARVFYQQWKEHNELYRQGSAGRDTHGATSPPSPSPSPGLRILLGLPPASERSGSPGHSRGALPPPGPTSTVEDEPQLERTSSFLFSPSSIEKASHDSARQFYHAFYQNWNSSTWDVRRGCIIISGMIELVSPRGFVVVDAVGVWDPKTSEYTAVRLNARKMGTYRHPERHER